MGRPGETGNPGGPRSQQYPWASVVLGEDPAVSRWCDWSALNQTFDAKARPSTQRREGAKKTKQEQTFGAKTQRKRIRVSDETRKWCAISSRSHSLPFKGRVGAGMGFHRPTPIPLLASPLKGEEHSTAP